MLQALGHFGILKGIRGPHGGYGLAREDRAITAEDILRATGSTEEADAADLPGSTLVDDVVRPLLGDAERVLLEALSRINVEDMTRRAESLK